MERRLKSQQGWLLFGGSIIAIFVLGLCVSVLIEWRMEIASIFGNRKSVVKGIEARDEPFKDGFPHKYQTWTETAKAGFENEFNGNIAVDALEKRPEVMILWAGYVFSKDCSTSWGHMHAIEDIMASLCTGSPMSPTEGLQPSTCWTCRSPDAPRMMETLGVDFFYNNRWRAIGAEIVSPIGCSDCHDPETMNLYISRPTLIEAFQHQGRNITKTTSQKMHSLVCAQCHVEYYFKGDGKYLTFPWDKGFAIEDMEAYCNEAGFYNYIHRSSRTPILKAQHPDHEICQMGIHGQRGASCADCHTPHKNGSGVKSSDHHIRGPLTMINRVCQVCYRESEETLRNNVYERQRKANGIHNRLERELARTHIEAKFAWDKGAIKTQMKDVLTLIRQAQWRWDFGVTSHGGLFHAPQEIQRILSHGLDRAIQARLAVPKVSTKNGYAGDVPMPDVSTEAKAQGYIGLGMDAGRAAKEKFLKTTVPAWLEKAKENDRLAQKQENLYMRSGPWNYKEGLVTGAGLLMIGLSLQMTVGAIHWDLSVCSIDVVVLVVYIIALVAVHLLRKCVYLFGWLSHYSAAASSLLWVIGMTVVMGLIRQAPSGHAPTDLLRFSQMTSSWPFVLLYLWMVTALGLMILHTGLSSEISGVPFLLNRIGLSTTLIAATLGNADIQRLKMATRIGSAEWRVTDDKGQLIELPLAVRPKDSTIDEYPPKPMLIDNKTDCTLSEKFPVHVLLEEGVTNGSSRDWQLTIERSISMAASMATEDILKFTEFHSMGATYAIYLEAVNQKNQTTKEGWVSCSNFPFPYKAIRLDFLISTITPEREPQRFASEVKIYTRKGTITGETIEVNRPMEIEGWKIYQLSYDEAKGRWSDISIFELVRDPRLPVVYTGIIVMIAGAVCLLVSVQKRKEEDKA